MQVHNEERERIKISYSTGIHKSLLPNMPIVREATETYRGAKSGFFDLLELLN